MAHGCDLHRDRRRVGAWQHTEPPRLPRQLFKCVSTHDCFSQCAISIDPCAHTCIEAGILHRTHQHRHTIFERCLPHPYMCTSIAEFQYMTKISILSVNAPRVSALRFAQLTPRSQLGLSSIPSSRYLDTHHITLTSSIPRTASSCTCSAACAVCNAVLSRSTSCFSVAFSA